MCTVRLFWPVSGAADRCGGYHPPLPGPQPLEAAPPSRGLCPRPDLPPGGTRVGIFHITLFPVYMFGKTD
jgi:hypothetical protein